MLISFSDFCFASKLEKLKLNVIAVMDYWEICIAKIYPQRAVSGGLHDVSMIAVTYLVSCGFLTAHSYC